MAAAGFVGTSGSAVAAATSASLRASGRYLSNRVIGPEGTKNMATHLEEAFVPDIRIRIADEKLLRNGVQFDAKDITPSVVYEANGVKVSMANS